jgi:hypothetical protein
MECSGLHSKPKAELHLEHLLTGPEEEEEETSFDSYLQLSCLFSHVQK